MTHYNPPPSQTAIEQLIARGWPTSHIMRRGYSYQQVQDARTYLEEVNAASDEPMLSREVERVYGDLATLEKERRRVHLDRLASFARERRRRAA